jgi:hypothetical protein
MIKLENDLLNYIGKMFKNKFPIFKKRIKHEEEYIYFEIDSIRNYIGYKIITFSLFLNESERLPYETLVYYKDEFL